ncbi:Glycosyl transferase family 2 [Amycolatopsis xylanica]|uniref:Glycosyl transferase family 2 n=2 Tax=Amycolatopsis xylanica TaxID=589385 RepID=A0A1H3A4P0_9PSEU|nr:Glycosyl transferase family 2 [Amycolatopsis xylanica]
MAEELARLRTVVEEQARTIEALVASREHMTQWLTDHGKAIEDHSRGLGDHGKEFFGINERISALEPLKEALRHNNDWLAGHTTALEGLHIRTDGLESAESVHVFTQWLGQLELSTGPKISVIMPTHNRAGLLPRAVASVLTQAYPNLELVIVDDASSDETPEVIAGFDDPRVRSIRTGHGGVCAARNAGLDVATGEVITYLDDDNTMHPLWLKALAWAFGKHPEVEAAYGGFVIDDIERVHRGAGGSLPRLMLRPYSREVLLKENLADISAVGHRAGLPAARFDESLREMGDWDLLCALTAEREPMVIPAIACFYSTDAPDRLSHGPTYDADFAKVRGKHAL